MVGTQIPVEERLHAVYRPDCDSGDGEALERNGGETIPAFEVPLAEIFAALDAK
jgi:hypothetical protein